jgi:hypothetical protein
VIDSGAYEQKIIAGTTRKPVFVWLYWTSEPPPGEQSPTPRKPAKKGLKKERDIKVKKEVKAEPEPTPKRPRAISGEVPTAKRSNTITRQQAKVVEEGPAAEEDLQAVTVMLQGVEGVEALAGGAGDD